MKLSQKAKYFIAGSLITILIFSMSSTAFASVQRSISVAFNDIKIYVDGMQINPTDSAGHMVEPFIYNGTTYLPVRAVAEAVGKSVTWDGNTNSVYLGGCAPSNTNTPTEDTNTSQYMSDILEPYQKTASAFKVNDSLNIGGKEYHKGYYVAAWNFKDTSFTFNLEGKFENITGLIGYYSKSYGDATLSIEVYGDNKLIDSYELDRYVLPQEVDLGVSGISKLKFVCYNPKETAAFCLCDMKIE